METNIELLKLMRQAIKQGDIKAAANNGYLDVVNILYQHGAQFETDEATKTPCLVQYMEIILTWFAFWWKMALTLPSSIKLEN